MIEALDIQVKGIVQGVGFRPFIYRLARRYLINGWVLNSREGVFIHAEGEGKLLDEFVLEISENPPAAAQVKEISLKEVPLQDCAGFEIRTSDEKASTESTLVSADLATCDDCLHELFDPANRRYRYPFINCTNCGPRFTIIDSLPYDRPATSMASFEMCPACAREYADPGNRRFHAQPDACWECGPHVSWEVAAAEGEADSPEGAIAGSGTVWGISREESDAIFAAAVDLLAAGGIVAVKGLGGFHLVCDAENPDALTRLRARKRRDGTAFAVMVPDVDTARMFCLVNDAEAEQLAVASRPIVLLRKRPGVQLADGLADKLPELGVMLPATPVQHLLIRGFCVATGRKMLVMTSGNVHDEPIVIDDADARDKLLGTIADALLGNDRAILARYDDSVVRVLDMPGIDSHGRQNTAVQFIRRARGYAPVPINIQNRNKKENNIHITDSSKTVEVVDRDQPALFAAGPEQKNTFAFATGGKAFVSQHIGDLEDADTFDAWLDAQRRYAGLFGLRVRQYACDLHPEYLATKWAREKAQAAGTPLVEVQHHHAHIASVLGEHALGDPVCGIAFDGTGYGPDGAIWGGEVLLANQADYERFANFSYVPMPGGAAAIKDPLRMAYGVLWAYDLLEHPVAKDMVAKMGPLADMCERMIEKGINTPMTSSVGRLFDAASALAGVCIAPTYEGEAAILFDAIQYENKTHENMQNMDDRYAVVFTKNTAVSGSTAHDTSVLLIDAAPTFKALLDDMCGGVDAATVARRFHAAIVDAIVRAAEFARAVYGIDVVALSGGVFMNRVLVQSAVDQLGEAGFTVALNADLPPNDGCISYGQAVVAEAAR